MNAERSLSEWLAYIERQHPKSIALGLDRVREVAQRMGLARPAKQVITIGGTNGKGSTVAFIEAIARAAGWKVGAYTSPHLLAYNERVRIDGVDASAEALVEAFQAVEAAAHGPTDSLPAISPRSAPGPSSGRTEGPIPLTYFEYATLSALWLFQRSGLDLAILEVGLGGRLDAVNLVDADVAVVTTVDLDHQEYLGDDRERIGFEKAGIARAWKPLVLGEDDPPASVLRHAYAIGASAIRAGCDFLFEPSERPADQPSESGWRWREPGLELELPMPRLPGPAQLRNAATAIAAVRALGNPVPWEAYAQGVVNAQLQGRLQQFQRNGIQIVVDVGHNPQAARELAAWMRQGPVPGRTLAVFAALGDKDLHGMVAALTGLIDGWFLAGLDAAGPRGLDIDAFAARLRGTAAADGTPHADVAAALTAACAEAQPQDRIVVFGSFHTAAAALRCL